MLSHVGILLPWASGSAHFPTLLQLGGAAGLILERDQKRPWWRLLVEMAELLRRKEPRGGSSQISEALHERQMIMFYVALQITYHFCHMFFCCVLYCFHKSLQGKSHL